MGSANIDVKKYFTQIPNIVDDMGLSVNAFRLYAHIKRVTGENGKCWESSRTLSKKCKISRGAVQKAKEELELNRLIFIQRLGGFAGRSQRHIINIVDIWGLNTEHYTAALEHSGKQKETNLGIIHEIIEAELSQPDQLMTNWSDSDPGGSQVSQKKNQNINIPNKNPIQRRRLPTTDVELKLPQAVSAVENLANFRVSPALYTRLIAALGETPNIERLSECFETWISRGYRVKNLSWALEWYNTGIPGRTQFSNPGRTGEKPISVGVNSHNESIEDEADKADIEFIRLNPYGPGVEEAKARLFSRGISF